MPALETFGAQPPIELLRQWMDFGGKTKLINIYLIEIIDLSRNFFFFKRLVRSQGNRNF